MGMGQKFDTRWIWGWGWGWIFGDGDGYGIAKLVPAPPCCHP